ncbi:MAG: tryptophan--tRNA ligase, partial [Lautropia sp.]
LPGLDGRKMSKSYDNTIPLFGTSRQLQKQIAAIVTDSLAPGEAKSTEGSALFQIFQAFATPSETAAFRQAFAEGISWADAKSRLFERLDHELAPMRTRYEALIGDPVRIEEALRVGALKARKLAAPLMISLRQAVGLRSLADIDGKKQAEVAPDDTVREELKPPVFKQYRERDGKFYFKLVGPQGRVLLQSRGFESPREAGEVIASFHKLGAGAWPLHEGHLEPLADGDREELAPALDRLVD